KQEDRDEIKLKIRGENVFKFKDKINFTSKRKETLLNDILEDKRTRPQRYYSDNRLINVRSVEIKKAKEDFVYSLNANKWHTILVNENIVTHQCDGDEDSILLLLDGLLNFSKRLLPEKRGGMMDAPLVLTVRIDPHEIDDESYTVDQVTTYSLEFYHKTLDGADPKDVEDIIDNVGHRLDSPAQYAGFQFSHPTTSIEAGPSCTAYKTLDSMEKKVIAQLNLAKKIRAVDAKDVAERVFSHHLLRDIVGCLRRFGRQKVRCTTCNRKYRRIPLSGNCPNCGGKLILTVSEGTVLKYLDLAEKIVNGQDLDLYHKQRIILLKKALESLFEDDSPKQAKLGAYI
ncbi:MAG: DNA-directed DNA polymerase II large subunit, partial [Candidatus Sifarchaeia archaeon]